MRNKCLLCALACTSLTSLLSGGVLLFSLGVDRCITPRIIHHWPWDPATDRPALLAACLLCIGALLTVVFVVRGCFLADPAAPSSSLDAASIISRLSFWWVTPTLQVALQCGTLDAEDLPCLPESDEPVKLYERFQRSWSRSSRGPYHLLVSLYACQRHVFFQSLCAGWAFLGCMLLDPILLTHLLDEAGEAFVQQLGLMLLLALSMLLRVTMMELCYFNSARVANNMRTALVVAVFRSTVVAATSLPHASNVARSTSDGSDAGGGGGGGCSDDDGSGDHGGRDGRGGTGGSGIDGGGAHLVSTVCQPLFAQLSHCARPVHAKCR